MKLFNRKSLIALVVSNMIGTGIFATLGIQLEYVQSASMVLILWLLGGAYALCGAVVYGVCSKQYPRNGGECHFLSKLIHPSVGFSAGLISIFTGFAAPLAITAIACASYLENLLGIKPLVIAILLLLIIALIHSFYTRSGIKFHLIITVAKILALVFLVSLGTENILEPNVKYFNFDDGLVFNSTVAIAFIYTLYAYSGWNAASYVVEETGKKGQYVMFSLIAGTLLVTILYVLVNLAFLFSVPAESITGEIAIGHVFVSHMLSADFALGMDVIIGLMLLSSISGMLITGSRVVQKMFTDQGYKITTDKSILTLLGISIFILLSFSFNEILLYTGFTLTIFVGLVSSSLLVQWIKGKVGLLLIEKVCLIIFVIINVAIIIDLTIYEMSSSMISWLLIIVTTFLFFVRAPKIITHLFKSLLGVK